MTLDLNDALGLLIATLGGSAVGLKREWSGHASGPRARFTGIRTFTLLGLSAGVAGWLWSNGLQVFGAVLVGGCAGLIVAACVAASRAEVDGTSEVAAFVVLTAGLVAGVHEVRLASAMIAFTTLLLVEKSRLHSLVRRIDDASLRAGFRFAVMAVVILPILPAGPYGPLGGIRPSPALGFGVVLFRAEFRAIYRTAHSWIEAGLSSRGDAGRDHFLDQRYAFFRPDQQKRTGFGKRFGVGSHRRLRGDVRTGIGRDCRLELGRFA
jgi:hypothetical protein